MTPERDLPPGYQFGDAATWDQRFVAQVAAMYRAAPSFRLPRRFVLNPSAMFPPLPPHRHYWIYDPLTDGSKCTCGAIGPSPADVAEGGHR